MKYDFIYDSEKVWLEKEYSIERERYDSPIVPYYVHFPREGVCVEVDADGNAIFRSVDGTELLRDKADGRGRYFSTFYCRVYDGTIIVRFPIQELVDHYPHCDGEYDRYSYITRDNVIIEYNL